MLTSGRWLRWLALSLLLIGVGAPELLARGRGQNIPFVMTAMGPIRKSDYYAHLMTPQQRAAQRKLEDDFAAKQNKSKTGSTSKPTSTKPTTTKK